MTVKKLIYFILEAYLKIIKSYTNQFYFLQIYLINYLHLSGKNIILFIILRLNIYCSHLSWTVTQNAFGWNEDFLPIYIVPRFASVDCLPFPNVRYLLHDIYIYFSCTKYNYE